MGCGYQRAAEALSSGSAGSLWCEHNQRGATHIGRCGICSRHATVAKVLGNTCTPNPTSAVRLLDGAIRTADRKPGDRVVGLEDIEATYLWTVLPKHGNWLRDEVVAVEVTRHYSGVLRETSLPGRFVILEATNTFLWGVVKALGHEPPGRVSPVVFQLVSIARVCTWVVVVLGLPLSVARHVLLHGLVITFYLAHARLPLRNFVGVICHRSACWGSSSCSLRRRSCWRCLFSETANWSNPLLGCLVTERDVRLALLPRAEVLRSAVLENTAWRVPRLKDLDLRVWVWKGVWVILAIQPHRMIPWRCIATKPRRRHPRAKRETIRVGVVHEPCWRNFFSSEVARRVTHQERRLCIHLWRPVWIQR